MAVQAGEPAAPPLQSRRLRLRPVTIEDVPFLHEVETSPETGWRFRFRGVMPSVEQYAAGLGGDVLQAFMIDDKQRNARVGSVAAYGANLHDGHAYVSVIVAPAYEKTGWGMEATLFFMNYLFAVWPLRKLYADVVEFNLSQFESGEGKAFHTEGVLKQHHYFGGRHWDQHVLAAYREEWLAAFGRTISVLSAAPAPSADGAGEQEAAPEAEAQQP
jgi:RimJ/RimL family protein N-acetyltransferase